MRYRSVFDIIGPIMVGPSSSHTAGAVRIGRMARQLFGRCPDRLRVEFFGSFAETYKGHGTDVAVVAGVLGFETFDARIPDSMALAERAGMSVTIDLQEAIPAHPNTVRLVLSDDMEEMAVTGISIGGGNIQIIDLNGFELKLSGDNPAILIMHQDVYGRISAVAEILTTHRINISHMEVSRKEKGKQALMVIETDQLIEADVLNQIRALEHIIRVLPVSV